MWAVVDNKGNNVSTIVRYLRTYPSHVSLFQRHVELLLQTTSVHIIKFAGAYATDHAICVVLQPLGGGGMTELTHMKQCGPLPEAFLSVLLRSTLRALQALSDTGHVPTTFDASHLWLGSEAVKLCTTYHFDWQGSDEARGLMMNDQLGKLPEIIYKLAGIPRERLQLDRDGSPFEELWAPGGFLADAKYGALAASMWPLRFGKEPDDKVRSFMEACADPDNTIDELSKHELIVAYKHLSQDVIYSWFQIQGEYERFKFARSFSAHKIFSSSSPSKKKRNEDKVGAHGQAENPQGQDRQTSAADEQNLQNSSPGDLRGPGKVLRSASEEYAHTDGHDKDREERAKVTIATGDAAKLKVEKIAEQADKMSDEALIEHLYELFQRTPKQGKNDGPQTRSGTGLFKGLRGLHDWNIHDFAKVCREFHILEKYRGAMVHTLGAPIKLRGRRGPGFTFKKQEDLESVENAPISDTAKKVLQLSTDRWRDNIKEIRKKNKLRTYMQTTIWGRIGKMITLKAFEEWHVIIMTKKLYDKREELRAIFGRDSMKRIFTCWVDFVFVEVQAPPLDTTVQGTMPADNSTVMARPKTREKRQKSQNDSRDKSPDAAAGSARSEIIKSPISAVSPSNHLKLPEISSAKRVATPLQGDEHLAPSPPAGKQNGLSHRSPRKAIVSSVAGGNSQRGDKMLVHEDRGLLIEDYHSAGFYVHQIGLIDVPSELRSNWITKGSLERVREDLRILECQHRDSATGVEVWSIGNRAGQVSYSAVLYRRSSKEHCETMHNHLRFLLSGWQSRPEFAGSEPVGLVDVYLSGKHIYVMLDGFPQGNLSLITRPDHFGPVPEPILSVVTRQMLCALGMLHCHGVTCNGQLKPSSFWLSSSGQLKLGALFHFSVPDKKNLSYAVSDDIHSLLEMMEALSDARTEGGAMLARHEFEFKINQYEHKIKQLKEEKNQIEKRQASAQSSGKQDKKQQMLDDTSLAVLKMELKTTNQKLETVRQQINQADEAMRLYPLTYSTTGRCHDFVAQATRPLLSFADVYQHPFVVKYIDVGSECLLRWVALGKSGGGIDATKSGNRLAARLYEKDEQVESEIENARQKPGASKKGADNTFYLQERQELMKIFQV